MQTIYPKLRPLRPLHVLTCVLLLLSAGCTSYIPRDIGRPPLSGYSAEDTMKLVAVPLPVIASTPNEGVTTGALTAFLAHNRSDEVATLIAPQVTYNRTFGATASLYGAFYPTPERNYEFNLSRSARVNHDYEFRGRDTSLLEFIDLGAVMESLAKASGSDVEFNPGVGFRAIVRPNIIGRVDIGIGRDGPAVFVGLGYPF